MILTKCLNNLGSGLVNFWQKNDTSIMTLLSIGGVGVTAYLSGKAAIKAYKIIEEENLTTPIDKFKRTWKIFLAPFASAVATISLNIGAQTLNLKRQAELVNTVVALQAVRKEFVDKTEEVVGKAKTEKIREEITRDKILDNPPNDENVIYTAHGDTLCHDEWGGIYFKHDIAQIKDVYNKMNNRINNGHRVSVADIYDELDIPRKYWPAKTERWTWSSETTGIIDPRFTSGLTSQEIPYFSIAYYEHNEPVFNY